MGALPCDAYHHYYHYQSSAQYLWLARACFALGDKDAAAAALKKALFQDHFNEEALALSSVSIPADVPFSYDKHPLRDATFLASVGLPAGVATFMHDEAAQLFEQAKYEQALKQFAKAAACDSEHSNSHFGMGKCCFMLGQFDEARKHVTEAVRLSHLAHDAYHRAASQAHVKRAREFMTQGEIDLAINDFSKALDLHRGNQDALSGREQAQKMRI